jgi:hypothetical protein
MLLSEASAMRAKRNPRSHRIPSDERGPRLLAACTGFPLSLTPIRAERPEGEARIAIFYMSIFIPYCFSPSTIQVILSSRTTFIPNFLAPSIFSYKSSKNIALSG